MGSLIAFLSGKKTYFLVLMGLLNVVQAFISGDATLADALNEALQLGGIATVRMGVAKIK